MRTTPFNNGISGFEFLPMIFHLTGAKTVFMIEMAIKRGMQDLLHTVTPMHKILMSTIIITITTTIPVFMKTKVRAGSRTC